MDPRVEQLLRIPLKIGKRGSSMVEVILPPQCDGWLVLAHSTLTPHPQPSAPMPRTPPRWLHQPWTPLPLFTHSLIVEGLLLYICPLPITQGPDPSSLLSLESPVSVCSLSSVH